MNLFDHGHDWRIFAFRLERNLISPNAPSDLSLLASGIQARSAGDMPEVPKARGLGRLARSALYCFRKPMIGENLL